MNTWRSATRTGWRPVFRFLGLEVGVIKNAQSPDEKRAAYACDITYGTNNEFGFDYLRDNLAFRLEDRVQRKLSFAIVDEVDSILIDEARTPLIISGPAEESTELYIKINSLIPRLVRRKKRTAPATTRSMRRPSRRRSPKRATSKVEELMAEVGLLREGESLYDATNIRLMHHLNAALRAHALYKRDVEYIVRQGEVIIVDEFTGRTMQGRRWSDGLHQAVEAKEGVRGARREPDRRVHHLPELLPPVFQALRHDRHGRHRSLRIPADLRTGSGGDPDPQADDPQGQVGPRVPVRAGQVQRHPRGHPGLREARTAGAGGHHVDRDLGAAGETAGRAEIPHEVLNAKQHEREAHIVAEAGRPGAITIATNMAGRGTDIVLGGNPQTQIDALENPNEEQIAAVRAEWQQAA